MKRKPSTEATAAWIRLMRVQSRVLDAVEQDLKKAGFPPLAWYDALLELSRAPTGELRPLAGTPLDFSTPTRIGTRINNNDEQLKLGNGYDHNYVLKKRPGELALAARVFEPTCFSIAAEYALHIFLCSSRPASVISTN